MISLFRHNGFLLRRLLPALGVLFLAGHAMAQIQVGLSAKRDLFVAYEPLLVTVSITNNSGHDIDLADTPTQKWFSFQIDSDDGRPIVPNDPNYTNPSVHIAAGDKLTRTVNLTPLYPISDLGNYRIAANVYVQEDNHFFSSEPINIGVTDGHVLWQKTVGVPEGSVGAGSTRTVTLLTHRLPDSTMLYLRVEDKDAGVVYCTHQLGRFVAFGTPQIIFDYQNQIYILHNSAPKTFLYSHIGLNGEVLDRKEFEEFNTRPTLAKTTTGSVEVIGGVLFDPNAVKQTQETLPSLTDRPVAMPSPPPPSGKKTPSDQPENLLSR
jgi:hypothetical protein